MSLGNISLYIVLLLLVTGFFYLNKKFSYFEDKKIPHKKPSSWIMGNLEGSGKKNHLFEIVRNIYEECKERDVIAGFYALMSPWLIITDLELVKHILVKDFNSFTDRGLFENEENEPLTANINAIGGDRWRHLRSKTSPAFTAVKIKLMFDTISGTYNNLVKAIEKASEKSSVDMRDMANRFTTDVVSSCAFGMETNTLNHEHPEFIEIFKKLFSESGISIAYFVFLFIFPRVSKFLKLMLFGRDTEVFFNNIVVGAMKYREENSIRRNDFLDMLIQLKNKGSIDGDQTETRKLTLNECVAQGFVFFLGGVETSSTTISFVITQLAQHPEIQEKLRKEILEKIEGSNGEITYDNLNEMTYLNQVFHETIRMYPTGFAVFRKAVNDYKVPNSKHVIKKGTQIVIPNVGFHYDERFWQNPYEFNPDRFTIEETAKRPFGHFMPFGEGPRNCVGMRFAQIMVKFAVATIIKNFKVSLDTSKIQLPLRIDPKPPALRPVGGFNLFFEPL